jgi:hypothetical protein
LIHASQAKPGLAGTDDASEDLGFALLFQSLQLMFCANLNRFSLRSRAALMACSVFE